MNTINTNTAGTITVQGLTATSTGNAITNATVTGVLRDSSGNIVTFWNGVTFTGDGSGNYAYSYTAAQVPMLGTYQLVVTAVSNGTTFTVEDDIVVQGLSL